MKEQFSGKEIKEDLFRVLVTELNNQHLENYPAGVRENDLFIKSLEGLDRNIVLQWFLPAVYGRKITRLDSQQGLPPMLGAYYPEGNAFPLNFKLKFKTDKDGSGQICRIKLSNTNSNLNESDIKRIIRGIFQDVKGIEKSITDWSSPQKYRAQVLVTRFVMKS
jgi:hypothetical protein